MIVPDLNLLVYAYNEGAPGHEIARKWWEGLMNGELEVRLPSVVALGFIRLMTNPKVIHPPMPLSEAVSEVKSWLAVPHVSLLEVTDSHWSKLEEIGWTGPAVSDAHLAALAIEHGCELHSNDSDFGQCAGLKWRNPLAV